MNLEPGVGIDVYSVGVLRDLRIAWWGIRHGRWHVARGRFRYLLEDIVRHVKRREWRALKNTFNGYLAEPLEWPPGNYRRRCGTGWTKRRALRSLARRLP